MFQRFTDRARRVVVLAQVTDVREHEFDAYEDVAASALAMRLSVYAFQCLSVMEVAMRPARSGSVTARACAAFGRVTVGRGSRPRRVR